MLATAAVALAGVAVFGARQHAALTEEYETAVKGSQLVERFAGLIYATRMESRGMLLATEPNAVRSFSTGVIKHSDQVGGIVTEQGAATQEIARSVEIAATRTNETADEIGRVRDATGDTRSSVTTVKSVADDLAAVAGRIGNQVEDFFQRLRAA